MKILGKITLLATLCLLGAAFSRPAAAATTLNDCQIITTSGDYVLGQNVSASGTCFSIRGNVSNITFDGNGKTITSSTGDALEVADFETGTPSHVSVKNFTSSSGVRVYGDAVRYVTFENLHVNGIVNYGGDDVTVKNNVVGEEGISMNNGDRDGWAPYRSIVTNNVVTSGSTQVKILFEIAGGNAHPCPTLNDLVDHNTFTETRNDTPLEANAVVRVRCAKGTTFTNNSVRSTGTAIGLYMRDESDGGTYTNNTFWTNHEESLRIASGNVDKTFPANNTFTNNVFRSDNGTSNFIQGIAGGNVFRNNLFWANTSGAGGTMTGGFGNIFDHNTFYNPLGECQYMNYRDTVADEYTNNIFSCGGTQIFRFDGYAASRLNADYNIYNIIGGTTHIAGTQTLSDWRANTASAGSADDVHSRAVDPLFTSATTGDFTLQPASPAKAFAADGTNLGYSVTLSLPTPSISMPHPTGLSVVHNTMSISTIVKDATGGTGIARVNFYLNGRKFSVDTTAPYTATLDTRVRRDGIYVIRAEVVGKNGTSAYIDRKVTIKNTFATRLALPKNSSTIRGLVILSPQYIYGGSTLVSVSYYRAGKLLGTSKTAPYKFKWDTRKVKNGLYSFTIKVRDRNGRIAQHTISLRVKN